MTINLEKSIDLSAPVEDVYNVWTQFSAFPDFMSKLHEVEITEQIRNESISWQTVQGLRSTTTVRFTPMDKNEDEDLGTTVTISVRYPNGVGTDTTAAELASQIEEDLHRFARLIEGQPPSALEDLPSNQPAANADVLGSAYAMSAPQLAPETEPLDDNPVVESFKQAIDSASNAWLTTMVEAFKAPLNEMRRLAEQFDDGLGSFMWGGLDRDKRVVTSEAENTWNPPIDVVRDGDTIKVTATLPGATKDDVHVEIRDGQLLLSGECNFSENGDTSSQFFESIDLHNLVDSSTVDARIDDQGVLEISMSLHPGAVEEPVTAESYAS